MMSAALSSALDALCLRPLRQVLKFRPRPNWTDVSTSGARASTLWASMKLPEERALLAQPTPLAADCFLAYWSRPSCPKDARQRSRRSRHSQDQVRSWQGWWRDRQAEIVAREPRLSLKRPRSPRLR